MPITIRAETPNPTPVHRMFDLDDIQAHCRIGKTEALELANSGGVITPPAPPGVITPPAPGHPGPKPKSASTRKAA